MPRGRPVKSEIRQNVIDLLFVMKEGYAYQIYKAYRALFPAATMRSIYYHLKKGVSTGEFVVKEVRKEKGDFSWGGEVEKVYYALGSQAKPRPSQRIKEYIDDH